MNIGIDISQSAHVGTGVARFTHGLTKAICRLDTTHTWTFLYCSLRQKIPTELKHAIHTSRHRLVALPIPPTVLSKMSNDMHMFPIQTFLPKIDWYISSDWTEPPANCNKATIVHDLVYLRHPETVHKLIHDTQQKRMKWVKKETSILFADSQSTAQDIESLLDIETKRIVVNYPGVETTLVSEAVIEQTKKTHHIDKPFILTVGKIEPRKNLARLIEAFLSLHRSDIDLVVVGQQGWSVSIDELIKEHVTQSGSVGLREKMYNIATNNIKFLGYIPDDQLSALYQSCVFFAFPSIWEGFGYPILEAMQLGAPVAGSNVSSMIELLDKNAFMFDPYDVSSIESALSTMLEDKPLRESYRQKGNVFAHTFTWDRYYDTLITTLSASRV